MKENLKDNLKIESEKGFQKFTPLFFYQQVNCKVSLRIIWLPEFIFETRQISYSGWKYQFPSLTLSLLLCCRDKKSGSNFRIYDSYATALFPLQFSHCFIFNWIFLQSSWKTLTKSHSFFLYNKTENFQSISARSFFGLLVLSVLLVR